MIRPTAAPAHRRHRGRVAWRVAITSAALVLAACSNGGDDGRKAGERSTTTTQAATPGPTTPGAPTTTTVPGAQNEKALPFSADARPDTSATVDGYPVLVSVTQGEHPGYRRYVFTFRHAHPEGHQPWRRFARPAWDIRYVPSGEAVMDGSGDPVANAGAKTHLRIRFHADMHYADGRSSLERSVPDEPPDLVFGGDFENQVTWFYGASRPRPFRAQYVGDGRVAVDIVN